SARPDAKAAIQTFRDCADCPEMVVVPAGNFSMGSPTSEPDRNTDEGPQHQVTFAQPFALGKYEVTLGEFRQFVHESGYSVKRANAGGSCWVDHEGKGTWKNTVGYDWDYPGYSNYRQ